MSLWVDACRPKSLDKLHYHKELSGHLKQLAASDDFPHLLVYGPSGAGKKTRIMGFLREVYGSGVEKLKIEHKNLKINSKNVDVTTLASNYHIEVNPSDLGTNDHVVVRELLKSIAESQQLDSSNKAFKVVVLSEADKLSKPAQQALRRIMEKYVRNCRYVLCCNSTSKVIPAIRSRCLGLRVGAPTTEQIVEVMQYVAQKQKVKLPGELATKIASQSRRNLRRAILMLESCYVQEKSLSAQQNPPLMDWEVYIQQTAMRILDEQSPNRLLEVRGRLFELLTHCIPADVIIQRLTEDLIANLDDQLKVETTSLAAEYEHRLQCGRKPIYHLEAFVAKFMSVYKKYLLEISMF